MRTAPNKIKPRFPLLKKMDTGGDTPNPWQSTNQWATKNQQGITAVGGYGAATVDAFAPVDAYGVRSNGAATASGALKGAATGAAIGSAIPIFGTAAGAVVGGVVGGVEGLIGNEKANKLKVQSIQKNTTNQLQQDQQEANARVAGDPSLKYGNMNASYYRFGGVMKNSPPTLPRTSKPLPAVQPAQRLMPNITESPNRQMSKMAVGGPAYGVGQLPNAIRYNATKLFRPDKSLKAQKNQILRHGGPMHRKDVPIPQVSRNPPVVTAHAPQVPSTQQPQQQMDPNQVAQMQQMMQQQGGMQQKADGGSIHINPANKGKFNATKVATGKSTEQLTHSSNPITKKRAVFAQNASHWNKKADGGQVEQLSSQDALINGPSHENGGVKFPSAGVELEGGETVNNGFVFSKKLGFAKPAAAIAGQLGKAEKRPESDVNNSTVAALQRKTELLKVHQEVAKKAAGIPSDLPQMAGGGPMPSDTSRRVLPSISDTTPMTLQQAFPKATQAQLQKQGGSYGLTLKGNEIPIDPTRSARDFSMGVPHYNLPANPSPATIHKTSYKFGGKMKKMDDGGSAIIRSKISGINNILNPADSSLLKTVDINGGKLNPNANGVTARYLPDLTPPDPFANLQPLNNTSPQPVTGKAAGTSSNVFNDVAGKVTPFLSNFVNATQKLPLPPIPQLNTELTPNLVDYSASRNEAVRANRSANAAARTNTNSGASVSASTAANLAGQVRAVSQINEAENNQNAQIRNSTAAENAQIRAGNTALQNNYQNELVQRQIKQQNNTSANMANVSEKIQGMARDNKLDNNEHTKLLLTALADPTGASWRGAKSTFAKYLSPDEMKTADAHFTKIQAQQDEDRAEAKKTGKLQQAYIQSQTKNAGTDTKSVMGVNPPSTIFKRESDKYDKNGNLIQETRTN